MKPQRVSLLDHAPRTARQQTSASTQIVAEVTAVDGALVWVRLGDTAPFPLPAQPGQYIVGAGAWVQTTEDRRPVRVLAPVRDAAAGEDTQTALPTLIPDAGSAELSPEDRARLDAHEQAITDAQDVLVEHDELQAQLAARLAAAFINVNGVDQIDASRVTSFGLPLQEQLIQRLWAEVITAQRVAANQGSFNDLTARHIAVTSRNGGRGTSITDSGLVLTGADGSAAIDLTNTSDTTLSILASGRRVAGIDRSGWYTGRGMSVAQDVIFNGGKSLIGALAAVGGRMPAKLQLSTRTNVQPNTTRGLMQVAYTVPRDGHRQVLILGKVDLGGAPAGWAVAGLHFSTNATTTTANTRRFEESLSIYPDHRGGGYVIYPFNTAELGVAPGQTVRILLSVQTNDQGVWVEPGTSSYLSVLEVGPPVPTTRVETEVWAPIEQPVQRARTSEAQTFSPSNWQTFDYLGRAISKSGSDVGKDRIVQGTLPGDRARWALVQFSGVQADLAGSVVERVRVLVPNAHWWSGSGGTVVLGVHGGIPSSLPMSNIGAWGLATRRMGRGAQEWVDLPATTHAGWQSGQTLSVLFFTTDPSSEYYGTFFPNDVRLEVTRQK